MLMFNRSQPARVHYMPNGFRVIGNGDHVICAVSGEKIMLDALRYWSVALQKPYATAEIATRAMTGQ